MIFLILINCFFGTNDKKTQFLTIKIYILPKFSAKQTKYEINEEF